MPIVSTALWYWLPSTSRRPSAASSPFPPSPSPPARCLLTSIEPYLQQLRHWASQCPENFQHQCSLVEAELARLRGEDLQAMEAYDRAIAQAAVGGFVQDEALANERAALFWLARGKVDFAKLYLVRAVSGYRYWGAEAKVATLEYQYPQLLAKDPILSRMSSPSPPPPTPKRHRHWNSFDLDAAIKASQAISGEIVLDRLLEKLMHLVITNAGAQRGLLILDSGGQLTVEAEGTMDLDAALAHLQCDAIVQQTPVEQMGDRLPVSVVNYVARTLENVVAGTKVLSFQFGSDPYLQLLSPQVHSLHADFESG
ncbi:MAG: hypothetical protein HC925_03770, partial [Coleofasciculaceae cyanobacterium SM2_3_26]|nr:hypothetical protein [Coleofasciculaceae cyanobacterium SM2_3_26]